MDDNGDVFNRISGTTGLTGSADTLLALHKGKRFDNEAILSVTSRDSQDIELTLTKDTTNGVRWKDLGTTEEIEANRKQEAYTNSRIRQAVLQLLAEQNSWIGTMSQFMEGHSWNIQSNHLSRELKQFQVNMRLLDSIEYIPPTKSSRLHQFKRI